MSLRPVNDLNIDRVVSTCGDNPVVVAFTFDDCEESKALVEALEAFAEENKDVTFLEADANGTVYSARMLGVETIPTVVVLERRDKCSYPMKNIAGFKDKPRLRAELEPWIN